MQSKWTTDEIGKLENSVFVVTGANSGLGYETARALAAHGGHVVMACRNQAKGETAKNAIVEALPAASLALAELNLASLASVRAFASWFDSRYERLDGLCNNAGVMALPHALTDDGFEMQLGTNHLGHFALTGLLLPRLLTTPGSRVVTLSSIMHRTGKIDFDDLQSSQHYGRWAAYGQSKLANLLFAYELQRRLSAGGHRTISLAAHPGYSSTNLQLVAPKMAGSTWLAKGAAFGNRLFAQSASQGALPALCALTSPVVEGGDYFGPGGPFQVWGAPVKVGSSQRAQDEAVATQLWAVSEELTSVCPLAAQS